MTGRWGGGQMPMAQTRTWRDLEQSILRKLWRLMGRRWEKPLFYQRSLSGVLREGLKRLTGIYWVGGILFERDLVALPIPMPEAKVPVEVVLGSMADIPRFHGLVPDDKLQRYVQRLEQGKVWLIATVDGEIAYSTWLSFSDEYDPATQTWVRVAPTGAYLLDSFTVPRFRELGLHTMMTARRLAIAKERGAERALGIVRDGNAAAWRVQKKLGAQKVEHILAITVLGKTFTRRSPLRETE